MKDPGLEKDRFEAEFKAGLRHFNGTEVWMKLGPPFPNILYTQGAQYVAEKCDAYWLLVDIASYQNDPKVRAEDFQVWKLKVDTEMSTGVLTCEDGNYNQVFSTNIAFTDFPVSEIELWYENNVIYLPSER